MPRTNVKAMDPSESIERIVEEGQSDRLVTSGEELAAENAVGETHQLSGRLTHIELVYYRQNGKLYTAVILTTGHIFDKIV